MLIVPDARETLLNHLPVAGKGMEIGVWRGQFSQRILKVAKPTILHLVDPWRPVSGDAYSSAWYAANKVTAQEVEEILEGLKKRLAGEIASGRIVIHRTSSTEALMTFENECLDYIYVDGDHTYEAVYADLTNAFRVVKAGGLICGDDYSLGGWWKDGVVRALHKFMASRPVVVEMLFGAQFVVRKLRAGV